MSTSRWYLLPVTILIGLPAPIFGPGELSLVAGPSLPHVEPPLPGPQLPGGVGGTEGGLPGTQLVLGGQAGGNSNPGMSARTDVLNNTVPKKKRVVLDNICIM
jgi:hypothetical protein